ncbi:MAG TPA: inverse autotransporter beta domain-containing protein [Kiritimatiellia bacterium]|nr:inverse autotransporter beta domain-containing protein [Kiritimatiellia bacterium]
MHIHLLRSIRWSLGLGLLLSLPAFSEPPANESESAPVDLPPLTLNEQSSHEPSWFDAGRLVLGGRFSSDVQEAFIDALVPVWQGDDAILFLNLRGTFLESREQEANAGLVIRRHLPDLGIIVGLNAFYDQRWTENDNRFDQVGGGVEVLSRWIDARFNYYSPLKDEVALGDSVSSSSVISGGQRVTTFSTFRRIEEALEGFDAEIGVWLPVVDQIAPTAVYVGYYDFSSDYTEDLSGWKARLESRICRQLTLDAEWFENSELNRTDYFVGFRIHLPLDLWNGVRLNRRGPATESNLQSRMSDMVYRDFRIRTQVTEPVLVDERIERTSAAAPAPASPPPSSGPNRPIIIPIQPPPPPPPPPPVCRIDPITGDVICE